MLHCRSSRLYIYSATAASLANEDQHEMWGGWGGLWCRRTVGVIDTESPVFGFLLVSGGGRGGRDSGRGGVYPVEKVRGKQSEGDAPPPGRGKFSVNLILINVSEPGNPRHRASVSMPA